METALSILVDRQLERKNWDHTEFAQAMGYQNLNKGRRRVREYLDGKLPENPDQFRRLGEALDQPADVIQKFVEEDQMRQKLQARLLHLQETDYQGYVQKTKYSGSSFTFPREMSEQEALEEAGDIARQAHENTKEEIREQPWGCVVTLTTPLGKKFLFDETGEPSSWDWVDPGEPKPGLQVDGQRIRFNGDSP